MKHITHNLSQEVMQDMPHFQQFYEDLKLLEPLLAHAHLRHRFAATCLKGTGLQAAFNHWRGGKVIQWRWGSIVTFLRELLVVGDSLKEHWNEDKFMFKDCGGGCAAEPTEDDVTVKASVFEMRLQGESTVPKRDPGFKTKQVAGFTLAIQSDFFWAYTKMLVSLSEVLQTVSDWVAGCPCHESGEHRQRTQRVFADIGTTRRVVFLSIER